MKNRDSMPIRLMKNFEKELNEAEPNGGRLF